MNLLVQEIKKNMHVTNHNSGKEITAQFIFPKEFIGFKGHFPDNPMLPGVCMIQSAIVVCQEWKRKKIQLLEIIQAKFFAIITAEDTISCTCKDLVESGDTATVTASLFKNNKKAALIRLKIRFYD